MRGRFWSVLQGFLLVTVAISCQAKQIVVGGEEGWTRGRIYEALRADVGDELVFTWTTGQHNVAELGTNSCEQTASAVVLFEVEAAQPAVVPLTAEGNRTFACSLPNHCENGQIVTVIIGNSTDADQERPRLEIQQGKGRCDDPIPDAATGLVSRTCYSPQITLKPGQIVDQLYILEDPFPADQTVGTVHHESNVIEAGTGRIVPLSEVYLHHVFADGSFVVGEGAEHAGSKYHPELRQPYYSVVPAGKFENPAARITNIHIISTLGVPADKILPCIECHCLGNHVAKEAGKRGGGACCSSEQCLSTLPDTQLTTYELAVTIKYRVLEPGMPVLPIYSLMMDNVGGAIEFDVHPPEDSLQADGNWTMVTSTGPIDGRCPQTQPLRVVSCLGHLHIGGEQMRLINADTGEVYCSSHGTYGTGARDDVGNEGGYLVAMSMQSMEEPIVIAAGTNVTMETFYKPEQHYGVMSLWFMAVYGFDTSCPGTAQASASAGRPLGYTTFGPDFAHQANSAFGFYNGQVIGQTGKGDEEASEVVPEVAEAAEAGQPSDPARNGMLLAGAVFGALLLAAALVALVVLVRRRQKMDYSKLHTSSQGHEADV